MDWKTGPPVLVGEKIFWSGNAQNQPQRGVVRWIGKIPELSSDWCVGVELEEALPDGGCDGFWANRKLFECSSKHGLLVPVKEIQKLSNRRNSRPTSIENYSDLKLDVSQLRDLTDSDLRKKSIKKNQEARVKDRYSSLEWKLTEWSLKNRSSDKRNSQRRSNRTSITEEVLDRFNAAGDQLLKGKSQDVKSSLRKRRKRKSTQESKFKRSSQIDNDFQSVTGTLEDLTNFTVNEAYEKLTTLDSKAPLAGHGKNMNDVAGYFKEIKEGDERFYRQEPDGTLPQNLTDLTGAGHPKQKKFFSFLKWFKKNKEEPTLKLPGESSAASSPMFVRKRDSSCESIDTLFSTQTVRSFAYIPPTQYEPSAPPSSLLDLDKSSYDNLAPEKNTSDECIYDKKKKRKAPEPPRLSRENSLPTTLEHKKDEEEDKDGIQTYHRRTVSESFKDKKAGAYCHVQGKRKAPLPPPPSSIYPNLQKGTNQYPSLHKKKKPAPPPPETNSHSQNQPAEKEARKEKEEKNEKEGESRGAESEEKRIKNNQTSQERLTKDVSLSPLPSRPWYKRSHRDSTGSNIIRKDLLKGFDKKKNKETDDWMPEVGFSRRSLSTESNHNKFNIFSRLEKNEEKKKEEKRKSQISILTNISELDREAAEIVRKEQAEEKKLLERNDARYYSNIQNIEGYNIGANSKYENSKGKDLGEKDKLSNILAESRREGEAKTREDEQPKIKEEKAKDKENQLNLENQSNEKPKPNPFSPNVLADLTNSSTPTPAGKIQKLNPASARLNYFNVENKELNYLNEPWVCQKCTLENPGWRVFCEICSSVKPKFLFNPTAKQQTVKQESPKPETTKQESPKPETSKRESPKPQEVKQETPNSETGAVKEPTEATREVENENEPEEKESLEELRKKRMTFFTPKLEPAGSSVEEKAKDERKESAPKNKPDENVKLKITEEPTETEVEQPQKPVNPEPKQSEALYGVVKKKQSKNEEIAEAYIVTKTIVLEDIIVKKGDKAGKTSSSAQTKSSRPPESAGNIRPPPRTKKIVLETPIRESEEVEGRPSTSKKSLEDLEKPSTSKEGKTFTQEDLEELTKRLTQAEGLADFRANIETMPLNTEMNTVAVNRLLRKLETAINGGDHFVAAGLAKELALMKINCSVTRQAGSTPSASTSGITIDLYVEDKISHQGPIPMQVSPTMTLLDLKKKVEKELGIPTNVQRWILGKKLATDDGKTLEAEGVKSDFCPVFLYLVAPDNRVNKEALDSKENVESKSPEDTPPAKDSEVRGKGWYYNYEEDHYSFCEDSDDDSRDASPAKASETAPPRIPDPKKEEPVSKPGKLSVFDLKTREQENDVEKELKLISANSVKQKVERLNRTFAENSRPMVMGFKSAPPLETWKCGCGSVNLPARFTCSACNAKKVVARLQSQKGLSNQNDPLKKDNGKGDNIHYKALIELQDADLVPNAEPFSCSICLMDYPPGEGVTLKDCLHTFCRTCLVNTVKFSEDAEVKCPYLDDKYSCASVLQQREIKALVPKGIFELHLAKSVKEAENKIGNAFHCKTPDCKGWCIYEDNVNEFRCPVCKLSNCLTCQAIHTGINCREYQERMKDASETDVDAKKTREMLEGMVEKGEAMACPKCQVVLMKKWGCDWLRCSMCKTEICWVTRGFRWGPAGKGDTTGGCKCGVNGVKCHPKCNYCH